MARKFMSPIDLTGNEIQNGLFQSLGSAPGSPVAGRFYYNSAAGRFYYYDGSAFVNKATDSDLLGGQNSAHHLARANHSGTQTASTISDLAAVVKAYRHDEFAAPTASVSWNSQKITSLADPTAAQDAATKSYVDNKVAGLSWKDEVAVATTANGTLATAFANGQTIDGYTLVTGDRILIKNQTSGAENGIYTVNASGAPTRATDADSAAEITGAAVFVVNGTAGAGGRYVLSNSGAITLGSTALTFVSFGGGSSYSAANGLTLVGSAFSVVADTGIVVSGSGVAIDPAVVARNYAVDVGNGSSTSITVTHNLGTRDVVVGIFDNSSPYAEVLPDVQHSTTNTITLIFTVAPTSNQYRCVVKG